MAHGLAKGNPRRVMHAAMKGRAILRALIEGGATISLAQGFGPHGPHGMAAAEFAEGEFYWVELWPDDQSHLHGLHGVRLERRGNTVDIYQGERLAASLEPMEPDERALFHWAEWLATGESHRAFAKSLLDGCLALRSKRPNKRLP